MSKRLHQKFAYNQERIFTLADDGVWVRIINGLAITDYKVVFENILEEPIKIKVPISKKDWGTMILIGIAGILFPIWLLLKTIIINPANLLETFANVSGLLIVGIGFSIYFLRFKKGYSVTFLYCTQPGFQELALYADLPTSATVDDFAKDVIQTRNTYIKEKYGDSSNTLSMELIRYSFLKEQGAITEEEFLKIKNDLLKDITGEKKSPGFLN